MTHATLALTLIDSAPWFITILVLLAAAAALGAAIWFSVFLIRRIEKITWRRQVAVRQVRIHNRGNVAGVFQLCAAEAGDGLSFQYFLDGHPLPLQHVAAPQPARQAPARQAPLAEVQPAAAEPASPPPAAALNKPGARQAAASAKKLESESKKALGKGRVLISIVGTLGSLIPGEWGKALKDRSTALQADAQKAGAAIELPSQKIATVKSLQSQTQSLAPGSAASKPAAPAAALAQAAQVVPPTTAPAQPVPATAEAIRPVSPFSSYVQTPPVPPEGALVVELHIQAQERYRTAEWPYWLVSCQVEQGAVPPAEALTPQRARQSVRIKALPVGYLLLTFLLDVGVICLNSAWVVLFIDWLTRLGA